LSKNPKIFIEHILECISIIEDYTEKISQDDFVISLQVQDAVIRRIEIIGEAVKNLPDSLRNSYPHIPWRSLTGMRDILIHQYFGVDLKLTWQTVKQDLPLLKKELLILLEKMETQTHS